jgi:hypothetical protein
MGCSLSCTNTKNLTGSKTEPVSETEKTINKVVMAAYAAISFEKGSTPDYAEIKSLFTPKATLVNFAADSPQFVYIDEFIAGFKAGVDSGNMTAFKEIELGGETEYFGNIGHRITAYASYFNGLEEIGQKGVNSFQLVKLKGQWLINSIIWDIEKTGQSIPERYLKHN